MNEITPSTILRLTEIHSQILGAVKTTLYLAIEAGQILTGAKDSLSHGEFIPWVKKNCPFSERTARRYMTCYERREELKTATVSDLTEAYRLLEAPKKSEKYRELFSIMRQCQFMGFSDAPALIDILEKMQTGESMDMSREQNSKLIKFLRMLDFGKEFWLGDCLVYGQAHGFTGGAS
ncbi:MAG: hypothetical protein A2W19_11770 [Spirochaetes bacterium RBG_16_49_21]|nr:MAG: hypothetical protein A2W19_11770 [Spirochaetes bacterium RBG_16_49_21]